MEGNGQRTLRDKYPIYCCKCGKLVLGDDYCVVGMKRGRDDSWQNLHHCRSNGCYSGPTMKRVQRITIEQSGPTRCLYCGTDCESRFCSERCRQLHTNEVRAYVNSDALDQLLRDLAQIRETQDERPHEPSRPARRTTIMTDDKPVPSTKVLMKIPDVQPFVPQNETGVIFMLGSIIDKIKYRMMHIDGRYPDAVLVAPDGRAYKVELEYKASNFKTHGHDPTICDLVICWIEDTTLPLPVIALNEYYDHRSGKWNFGKLNSDHAGR